MKHWGFMALLFASLLFAGCWDLLNSGNSTNSDNSTNPDNPAGTRYAKEYWGEWLRMDSSETWYISGNSIKINNSTSSKAVSFSKQSDRVIEVTENGRKYYLYASRIANASFTGRIAGFDQTSPSVSRAVGGGKGWINVVIEDLDNGSQTTTKTDGEGNFTADDTIPGDDYKITPEGGTPVTVTPGGDGDDVGTITITNGLNFKSSVKPKSSSTDMTRLYANMNAYELNIEVENTGTVDCTAATFQLAFASDLIAESVPASAILGTIEPGKKKTIEIKVRCLQIQNEYEYKKIGVTINDPVSGRTWQDSVSLRFHKAPVNFNIRANHAVSGIIIAPTAQAYSFRNITSATLSLPWSAKDYLVVFSGATAETEAVYSLGIGVTPDSNFDAFSDTGNYEPNNTETSAIAISMESKIMSYLYKNDIDYYKVNLGTSAPAIHAVSLVNFAYKDINSNNDGKIQPSESAYLDIMVKNNVNAAINAISATLSTSSSYVTLDKSTGTIGNLNAGYYQTLTLKAYNSSSTGTSSSDSLLFYYSSSYYSSAFKFTVSESCPVGTNIPFVVTFTDSWGNTWTDSLTITVE